MTFKASILLSVSTFTLQNVYADQPIMNMMPRWNGGYGFQIISEHINRRDLLDGDQSLGSDLYENIHKLNVEGVYTWDKSIRLTAKIPYIVNAERTVLDQSGEVERQTYSGFGDLTLALPLKKYFNEDGYSGSWTFTPQLRIPTGSENNDYTLPDRAWATGVQLGYEVETSRWFFSTGVSLWEVYSTDPFEFHTNLDIGVNFLDRGQFLIETDYHWEDDRTRYLTIGPALYWRFSDTTHSRLEWKQTVSDYRGTIDHGNSTMVRVGVGWVF